MTRLSIRSTDYGLAQDLFPGTGDHALVTATTARGEVFIRCHDFATVEKASRFADVVAAAGSIDPELWTYWRTVYGSQAFCEQEQEVWALMQVGAREEGLSDELRTLA